MPIYEYKAKEASRSCEHCSDAFEELQKISDPPLKECPKCGAPVEKQISAPSVGRSETGFDDRAKAAGFSKLRKISKGEYEKEY